MATIEFDRDELTAETTRQLAAAMTGRNGLAWQAIQQSHARLREWADEYEVEPIIDSLEVPRDGPAFQPEAGQIDLEWRWTHPAAEFFARGTSPHTINGNPILSFIWEDAPTEVSEMFPHTERVNGDPRVFFSDVTVAGIDRTDYDRHGLAWLRDQLRREFG